MKCAIPSSFRRRPLKVGSKLAGNPRSCAHVSWLAVPSKSGQNRLSDLSSWHNATTSPSPQSRVKTVTKMTLEQKLYRPSPSPQSRVKTVKIVYVTVLEEPSPSPQSRVKTRPPGGSGMLKRVAVPSKSGQNIHGWLNVAVPCSSPSPQSRVKTTVLGSLRLSESNRRPLKVGSKPA